MPGVTQTLAAVSGLLLTIGMAGAQTSAAEAPATIEQLKQELNELKRAVAEVRGELARSARESAELRREVTSLRARLEPASTAAGALGAEVAATREEQQVLNAKVEEQHQSKVGSGSRYRVKLSGMALMNVVSTSGEADNMDVPFVAQPKPAGGYKGSFGATARQSSLGLQVSGPTMAGARTSGEVRFDFFAGFPDTPDGVTAGLMRLRTATFTMDWDKTTVVAGQEAPFFSPLSPTSMAAVGYPALSYAGNLWTWTPQVYAEHRFAAPGTPGSTWFVQGGILDALTGDSPASEYTRVATAGERSRVPAFASRIGWRRGEDGERAELGASGYYSRQNWGFGRVVDGWAGTLDWTVPLSERFTFSGEMYRGNAIAGLGGGAAPSVLILQPSRAGLSPTHTVASAGGWSQLKFKAKQNVEFNAAFGQDQALGFRKVEWEQGQNPVRRNTSGFVNVIYHPRSNLVFSVEYRRMRTLRVVDGTSNAGHVNIGAGILF